MILKVLGAKFFLLDFLSVHVSFFHFPFALLLNPNVHVEPLLYIYIYFNSMPGLTPEQ